MFTKAGLQNPLNHCGKDKITQKVLMANIFHGVVAVLESYLGLAELEDSKSMKEEIENSRTQFKYFAVAKASIKRCGEISDPCQKCFSNFN